MSYLLSLEPILKVEPSASLLQLTGGLLSLITKDRDLSRDSKLLVFNMSMGFKSSWAPIDYARDRNGSTQQYALHVVRFG